MLFLHHVFFILDTNRQPPIHPPAKCRQVTLHHTQWDSLVLQSYLSCHPGGYDCIPGKVAPLQIPCCSDFSPTSLVNFHGVSFRWCEKYFFLSKSSTQNNITRPPHDIKWYPMELLHSSIWARSRNPWVNASIPTPWNTALRAILLLFNSRCCPASDWWCEISQGLGTLPKIALGMGKNMEVDSMHENNFLWETYIFHHWKKNLSSSKVALKNQDMLVPRYFSQLSDLQSCSWTPKNIGLVRVLGRREKYLASSSKARIPGRPAKALVDFRIFGLAQQVESCGMMR